ncbi:hypothetical protein KKG29_01500 [Patescibacteria group bacterium]|nr:hypothetical protein [Patescibacteria group bacterium]MBU3999838.1 hypothetical protein [Patescibacteria group bacterium]MBU4368141.1 hypothetical protein [Patescibacteria group bacterium]
MSGKRMNALAIMGLLIVAIFAMAAPAEARFAPPGNQYDRQAMVGEATYAIMGPYYGPPYGTGKWNYMASDLTSQRAVVNIMGGIGTNAGWTADGVISGHPEYGFIDGVGRGGQCLFFVNLLLYRSEADRTGNLNNWNFIESHSTSIDNARGGDLVFRPRTLGKHIAVVYARSGDSISVIESNYQQPEKIAL